MMMLAGRSRGNYGSVAPLSLGTSTRISAFDVVPVEDGTKLLVNTRGISVARTAVATWSRELAHPDLKAMTKMALLRAIE